MNTIAKLYSRNQTLLTYRILSLFSTVKFTKTHEWVETVDAQKRARIGITNFAQSQLGEIVHIQLPTVGKNVKSGDSAMTIESVKMAADIYSPVSGKIVKVNEQLTGNPGAVNESAEKTWLFEVEYNSEPSGLLNKGQYEKISEESH